MLKYSIDGRIWINCCGISFLGSGKIELLLKIKELGSLRKAAVELNMSYRKAWYGINQVNKLAPEIVVILSRGGKNGGVARITEYGEYLINTFGQLVSDFNSFIENKTKSLVL
jgi:molybdate transport system regulatory protein